MKILGAQKKNINLLILMEEFQNIHLVIIISKNL